MILLQIGNFTVDQLFMDDLKEFEGRKPYDFDRERERIITTILVCFFSLYMRKKFFFVQF